jgi:hypothetical protein
MCELHLMAGWEGGEELKELDEDAGDVLDKR